MTRENAGLQTHFVSSSQRGNFFTYVDGIFSLSCFEKFLRVLRAVLDASYTAVQPIEVVKSGVQSYTARMAPGGSG